VKNEDKIDELHKSQLKFEYEIYFFIKLHDKNKRPKNLHGFCGFFRFFRNLGF